MLVKKKSFPPDPLKQQVYFRIVPNKIKSHALSTQDNRTRALKFLLYFEKGMQILGKTQAFSIDMDGAEYQFNINDNKFDFQIASEKNLNYSWSLYEVDPDGYEERLGSSVFSIKEDYQKYDKQNIKTVHNKQIALKNNLILSFNLYIQNTSSNLIELLKNFLPESGHEDTKSQKSKKSLQSQIIGVVKSNEMEENKDQRKFASEVVNIRGNEKEKNNIGKQQAEQQQKVLTSRMKEAKQIKSTLENIVENSQLQDLVSPNINELTSKQMFQNFENLINKRKVEQEGIIVSQNGKKEPEEGRKSVISGRIEQIKEKSSKAEVEVAHGASANKIKIIIVGFLLLLLIAAIGKGIYTTGDDKKKGKKKAKKSKVSI